MREGLSDRGGEDSCRRTHQRGAIQRRVEGLEPSHLLLDDLLQVDVADVVDLPPSREQVPFVEEVAVHEERLETVELEFEFAVTGHH